jgi:putative transposase
LLKRGARRLLEQAVQAELSEYLGEHSDRLLPDGRQAVVRNGYLPEREFQTGIGSIDVKVPKVRDRGGEGACFRSELLPPYVRRSSSVEAVLPWLYLKGVSTGDFQEALAALLGESAKGLSASTISRLKGEWEEEYKSWSRRSLKGAFPNS